MGNSPTEKKKRPIEKGAIELEFKSKWSLFIPRSALKKKPPGKRWSHRPIPLLDMSSLQCTLSPPLWIQVDLLLQRRANDRRWIDQIWRTYIASISKLQHREDRWLPNAAPTLLYGRWESVWPGTSPFFLNKNISFSNCFDSLLIDCTTWSAHFRRLSLSSICFLAGVSNGFLFLNSRVARHSG